MDFLNSLTKSDESKPKPNEAHPNPDQKTSNPDLIGSCKTVAEAAQAQLSKEPANYDKAKAAGAGADILDAGEKYAKLDETKGAGKYVEQAEDYLRKYGHDSKPAAPASEPKPSAAAPETEEPGKKSEGEGGGAGDIMKKAGGFFK